MLLIEKKYSFFNPSYVGWSCPLTYVRETRTLGPLTKPINKSISNLEQVYFSAYPSQNFSKYPKSAFLT